MVKALKRVLTSPKDIELALKPFYSKFFDVFLSSVRYNTENTGRQTSVVSRQSEDGERQSSDVSRPSEDGCQREYSSCPKIDWEDVLAQLNRSSVGHLFLASSIMGAKWLLNRLIVHNFAEKFSIVFCEPGELSANAVVLAPDFHKIPFRHYNRIYVLEGEELLCPYWFFEDQYAARICVLRMDDAVSMIKEWCLEHLKIDREFLAHFYKWLKLKKNGRLIWKDMHDLIEDYNKSSEACSNEFQISVAMEVFSELGFIIVNVEHRCVKIEFVPNPPKRSLYESKIYFFYTSFMRRFDLTTNGGNLNGFETDDTNNP